MWKLWSYPSGCFWVLELFLWKLANDHPPHRHGNARDSKTFDDFSDLFQGSWCLSIVTNLEWTRTRMTWVPSSTLSPSGCPSVSFISPWWRSSVVAFFLLHLGPPPIALELAQCKERSETVVSSSIHPSMGPLQVIFLIAAGTLLNFRSFFFSGIADLPLSTHAWVDFWLKNFFYVERTSLIIGFSSNTIPRFIAQACAKPQKVLSFDLLTVLHSLSKASYHENRLRILCTLGNCEGLSGLLSGQGRCAVLSINRNHWQYELVLIIIFLYKHWHSIFSQLQVVLYTRVQGYFGLQNVGLNSN
jgi:hypothetical protein